MWFHYLPFYWCFLKLCNQLRIWLARIKQGTKYLQTQIQGGNVKLILGCLSIIRTTSSLRLAPGVSAYLIFGSKDEKDPRPMLKKGYWKTSLSIYLLFIMHTYILEAVGTEGSRFTYHCEKKVKEGWYTDIPTTWHLCHLDIEKEEVDSLVDCRNCGKLAHGDYEEETGEDYDTL